MAAAVLVSGPALRPLLQLVDQTDGAAGEGLEAHGDHGKAAVWFLTLRSLLN